MRSRRVPQLLTLLVVAACADGVTTPIVDDRNQTDFAAALVDSSQPGAVVPGFFFLPPTVAPPPPAHAGTFDPSLSPIIEICPLNGTNPLAPGDCAAALLATLTMDGTPPEVIRVTVTDENYSVTWKSTVVAGRDYRAFVRVGAVVLGYIDLRGTRRKNQAVPAGFVGVVAGQPFLFKFRIETGIAGGVIVTPPAATIMDAGTAGEMQGFTATVLDLHGEPLTDVDVDWSVSHALLVSLDPTSGTTDAAGQTATTATVLDRVTASSVVDVIATVHGSSGKAQLTVEPTPGNPIGVPDAYGVVAGTTLDITAPGVLANDIDLEGDAITVSGVVDDVEHGTLALQSDGSFTYTPDPTFIGTDGFTYVAVDGGANASDPVTVTIEVLDPSESGPIANDDYFLVVEGKTLSVTAPGFLANDIDRNGEAITAISIQVSVDNGTLAAFPSGTFTYTPDPGFVGTDQFTYRMRDESSNTDEATVVIEVLADPDKLPVGIDDRYVVIAGTTLAVATPGFLGNDLDPDGAPLSATAIAESVDNGTLAAFPSGSFSYTPNPGFTGTDQFTYQFRDPDSNVAEATVTIEVLPASTALPVATTDTYATMEGIALQIDGPGFLANDLGVNVEAILISDNVDNGSLAAFPSGSFTYTPDPGFIGTDQFTYRMRDASLNTSDATVIIHVFEDPDKEPVATPDVYTAIAGATLNMAAPGFLANDLDPDGEAIEATAILDNVDNGTLGAFPSGSFTYTPDPGFIGTDQFAYLMRNKSLHTADATVTIHVIEDPNRAPVLLPDFYATIADMSLTVAAPGFLGNDVDREGEAISATVILVDVENGTLSAFPNGSFTYTPNPGFIGTDKFTYNARDESFNLAEGAVVTIEVLDPDLAAASLVTMAAGSGIVIGNGSLPAGGTPLGIGTAAIERRALTPPRIVPPSVDRGEPLPLSNRGTAEAEARTRYRVDPDLFAAGKRPLPGTEGRR